MKEVKGKRRVEKYMIKEMGERSEGVERDVVIDKGRGDKGRERREAEEKRESVRN